MYMYMIHVILSNSYAGTPTAADASVIQESYNFNNPMRVLYSQSKSKTVAQCSVIEIMLLVE